MDPIQTESTQQVPPETTAPVTPPPTSAPLEQTPEHKKVGPIVAVLVVVLVLVIGALYIFASRMNQAPMDDTSAATAMMETQQTTVTPVTNTSDDVTSIEADLNASVDGLDAQNF